MGLGNNLLSNIRLASTVPSGNAIANISCIYSSRSTPSWSFLRSHSDSFSLLPSLPPIPVASKNLSSGATAFWFADFNSHSARRNEAWLWTDLAWSLGQKLQRAEKNIRGALSSHIQDPSGNKLDPLALSYKGHRHADALSLWPTCHSYFLALPYWKLDMGL